MPRQDVVWNCGHVKLDGRWAKRRPPGGLQELTAAGLAVDDRTIGGTVSIASRSEMCRLDEDRAV